MILFWLVLGMLLSLVVHEASHLLLAKKLGWTIVGAGLTWKVVGVRVKTEDKAVAASAWLAALAGPFSNLVLADIFFVLPSPIATVLAYFNLIVAAVNLLPIPGADGSVIIKSLRGKIA